jgi:hypothetical protein
MLALPQLLRQAVSQRLELVAFWFYLSGLPSRLTGWVVSW